MPTLKRYMPQFLMNTTFVLRALPMAIGVAISSHAAAQAPDVKQLDGADTRLGWQTASAIARLPADQQPPVDPTCAGNWVTPVGPHVPVGEFNASEVEALANSAIYNSTGGAELSGNVALAQQGRMVEADIGSISEDRRYATFTGNIRLAEPGLLLSTDEAVVDLQTRAAQLNNTEFVSSPLTAHGRAEQVRRLPDGNTIINNGIFTTCAPNRRVWSVEADSIELNEQTGMGKIRDGKLRLHDLPVLYVPYFQFPIDDRRQTGFLVPRIGSTNNGGFDLATPIYLNVAPQFDATLTPRILAERGAMLEAETRFLSQYIGSGEVEGSILPDDDKTGQDRKRGSVNHRAQWSTGWSTRSSLNYVSDNAYFTDLGTNLVIANQTHQERVGEVAYANHGWDFLLRAQGFQTIDPGLTDADKPYKRIPQFVANKAVNRNNTWQSAFRFEATQFERDIDDGSAPEINATRLRFDPEVAHELKRPWGNLRTSAKLTHLNYMLSGRGSNPSSDNVTVTAPTFNLDGRLIFDRLSPNGSMQTLEPRLYYLYSPYRDQSALPNFDSAFTTFSYDQLFRSTRFSGYDRIDDANQLSYGLTSRWLSPEGLEYMQSSFGQIVYFRDRLVSLQAGTPIDKAPTSSYAGNLVLRANQELSFYADALMDPEGMKLSQYSAAISHLPLSSDRLYNVGYRFRRNDPSIGQKAVSQTQLSFVQPINANWKALGLWNYDLNGDGSTEALFGVQYEACCWQVKVYRRSFLADAAVSSTGDRRNDAIFFEIVLKGLAGFGSNVDSLFERNVFGFTQLKDR